VFALYSLHFYDDFLIINLIKKLMSTLIIDIREEQELLDYQIVSKNGSTIIINIPTRSIFANVDFINQLSGQFDAVFIVCRTNRRAKEVKNRYFSENPKILTLEGGWKAIMAGNSPIPGLDVIDNSSLLNLAPQQYMQSVIVAFLCGVVLLNYKEVDRKYISGLLLAFAGFIAYQVLTKDCTLTRVIPLPEKLERERVL
jgi:rhodanese-related sulfurtransferase